MKAIIVPGVGYHKTCDKEKEFAQKIQSISGVEIEVFSWNHTIPLPEINLPYKNFRELTAEVLLDAQFAILDYEEVVFPDVDFYIGHSAGSLLILAKTQKPCIIFGSPAALTESLNVSKHYASLLSGMRYSGRQIVNIINRYDILSYPLDWPNVENIEFQGKFWNPLTYSPFHAHTGYWDSKFVIDTIATNLISMKRMANIIINTFL